MIRLKIDKNRQGEPTFKIGFKELEQREGIFLKRVLMEGKIIKGAFKYEVPLKYFTPIINNLKKDSIKIDRHSKLSFFEFSDRYDEKYYYTFDITAKYMKKWREEECPNIFKVVLNSENMELTKEIVFKKIIRQG